MSEYDPKSRYYAAGGIEALDVVKAKLTPEQYQGFLLGNALKYLTRCMHKGETARDAEKAANFAVWFRDEWNTEQAREEASDARRWAERDGDARRATLGTGAED